MAKQLALSFEEQWWAKVIVSLSEEQKVQVVAALKEMLAAALEMTRKGGITDGERGD
jgi:hypothetical protein